MKIVIAPDSFKGSLSAMEVARAIELGVKKAGPEIETILIPLADGGEGTVQSLIDATNGRIVHSRVNDPLLREIDSFYGILGDGLTAVIEMAAASGIALLSENERDPLKASTYGTGQLILHAIGKGCHKFIIGLGGSATNDAGCGMAEAVGIKFLDKNNLIIGSGGGALGNLKYIDFSNVNSHLKDCSFTAACDVSNPLCGENGASAVYGPQKGASKEDLLILDSNLAHFAEIVKWQTGKDILTVPGAGAAGGMGAGVDVFLNATLKPGFDIVSEITDLQNVIKGSDLIITGEGKIDYQTLFGKTPFGVAKIAKTQKIPVIAIAGTLGENFQLLYNEGFSGIFPISNRPVSLEYSMKNAAQLIEAAAERIVKTLQSSMLKK